MPTQKMPTWTRSGPTVKPSRNSSRVSPTSNGEGGNNQTIQGYLQCSVFPPQYDSEGACGRESGLREDVVLVDNTVCMSVMIVFLGIFWVENIGK